MLKALNLGSLRSSSVSISGNGPPKLGAGWGSEVSTWMVTRLSARGEKGAVDVVAGVVVTGVFVAASSRLHDGAMGGAMAPLMWPRL